MNILLPAMFFPKRRGWELKDKGSKLNIKKKVIANYKDKIVMQFEESLEFFSKKKAYPSSYLWGYKTFGQQDKIITDT
jgi:hypothetical protein